MRRVSLLLVGLFFASACSGKLTFRDICSRIAEAGCDKREECDPPAPDNCKTNAVNSCCAIVSDCDIEIEESGAEDELDECVSDYEDLTCTQFENGEIPQSCE